MVARIRSRLVHHTNRLAIQSHKLALEPNVSDLRDVLLPAAPVILEEQRDRGRRVPVRAVQGQLENILPGLRLRHLDGLRRGEVGSGAEIQVGAVFEQLEGLGSGWGRCGVEQKGVELYLAGEPVRYIQSMVSDSCI